MRGLSAGIASVGSESGARSSARFKINSNKEERDSNDTFAIATTSTRAATMQRTLAITSRALSRHAKRATAMRPFSAAAASSHEYILVDKSAGKGVAQITLNRPKALNALCDGLIAELNEVCAEIDADDSLGAIVITGSEKAFAAGADIKEMAEKTWPETYKVGVMEGGK